VVAHLVALVTLQFNNEFNMPLPIYQPTGYLPADIPRFDRADVKETALQLQTIEGSLDKLSNFAFKKANEQAEREGL